MLLLEIRYTVGDIGGEDVKRVQAHPVGSDEAEAISLPINVNNDWIVDRYDLTTDNRAWIRILEASDASKTIEDTIFTGVNWGEKVNALLFDLDASTATHPYSGLMAESVEGSEAVVKIFDDYASGQFYADQVCIKLEQHGPVNWDEPNPLEALWGALKSCEI